MAQLDELRHTAERRYVVMFDATDAHVPTGRQIRMLADWLRDRGPKMKDRVLANAHVLPSAGIRGALKALFTLQHSPVPYAVVATAAEGRAVLQRFLAARDSESGET